MRTVGLAEDNPMEAGYLLVTGSHMSEKPLEVVNQLVSSALPVVNTVPDYRNDDAEAHMMLGFHLLAFAADEYQKHRGMYFAEC